MAKFSEMAVVDAIITSYFVHNAIIILHFSDVSYAQEWFTRVFLNVYFNVEVAFRAALNQMQMANESSYNV